MPLKGQSKRDYQKIWTRNRREEWIKSKGGYCAYCGDTEGPFDVDHIDKSTKKIPVRAIWNRKQEIRDAELSKCQVLCERCHQIKSNIENTKPIIHGTYGQGYGKKCKCDMCMEAMRQYWRNRRAK